VEKLLRIRDHLSLAAKQAAALGNSRIESLESAFSSADRGVAALDWSGRITLLNGRAEEILRGAELSSTNVLRSRDRTLDQRLADLVAGAIGYKFSPGLMLPGPVVIPTGDDRSIVVDAVPMPRDFQALLSGAAALLTLHEVADQKAASVKDARKLFRLTVREAELAAHLVAGSGIAEAAAALGMSVSTARQHVKSIFVKTDTHRQAELVALLARFRN
jgi:DNA-binding CsgD family transcriptional regulator